MSFASVLLYPLAMLLPAASVVETGAPGELQTEAAPMAAETPQDEARNAWPPLAVEDGLAGSFGTVRVFQSFAPQDAWQVRIQQRMTIRITPRASGPHPGDPFFALPQGDGEPRYVERKIGKCLPVASIAGVRPQRGNRLLLFLSDRRVVSAELERACRAQDFYSGFYLSRSSDGKLCVERDELLSRSGMNCRLTSIRQLIEKER